MLTKVPKTTSTQFTIKNTAFELIEVEGGRFQMGSNEHDREKPIHEVEVSNFLLGKYPVTQALWETVMGDNPASFQDTNRPVEQVSWYDAVNFCNRLSEQLGKEEVYSGKGESMEINYKANGFRLPTEAEWEYAARGGKYGGEDNFKYSGSNEVHQVGWYRDNSHDETKPVGMKKPNQLGIYDMSGNVWEWCNDRYKENYREEKGIISWLKNTTKEKVKQNPKGPKKGDYRVLRGGSWFSIPASLRVADRFHHGPEGRSYYNGFRLCLSQF